MDYFDKALNATLEGIERNVVDQVREAASALEEYPGQDAPESSVVPADWSLAPRAIGFWRTFSLEAKKAEFHEHLARIKSEKSSRDKSVPSLIRRAEESEEALTELCQQLLQGHDPSPFLAEGLSSHKRIQELVKENGKLQKDREAAEKEATTAGSLVSQAQQAGEAHAKLRKQLEEAEAKIAGSQQEIAEVEGLKQQRARLETELGQLRGSFQTLQTEHQRVQNQLFDLRSSREAAASHLSNDAEVAALEHERALNRVRQLEHMGLRQEERIQELLAERESATLASIGGNEEHLSREIQRLQAEVEHFRRAEQEMSPRVEGVTSSLQHAQQHIARLEASLASRPSEEELRDLQQRLRTAETLLDAQMAAEGLGADAQAGRADQSGEGSDPTQSLVSILQARNRRLTADNGVMRRQVEGLREERAALQASLRTAEEVVAHREAALHRLEEDLVTSTRLLDQDGQGSPGGEAGGQAAGGTTASGMLQIVGSQRDRFKARVQELEQEVEACRKDVSGAAARAQQLERDNVGLYERIRYLQRYRDSQAGEVGPSAYRIINVDSAGIRQNAGGMSHRMSCGPFQVNLGGEQGGRMRSRNRSARFSCLGGGDGDEESAPKSELEQRYAKAYESRINPFAEFQANEREERLPTHERALLAGSKLILSNRPGRIFAVVYFVALHIFLFCLVYHIMLTSGSYVATITDTAAS